MYGLEFFGWITDDALQIKLNIDTDAWVVYTNKLERLSKNALPKAVSGTLNSLAFDVKKTTMPESADKAFTIRKKNFFIANSRVEMARGNNVSSMRSVFGFVSLGGTNSAIDDLEKQESGGVISGRAFIPTDLSRTGKSKGRLVSRKNRIGCIKKIVRVSDAKGKSKGQKFIKSVVHAGKGGYILSDNMLFRVTRLKRAGSGWKFKLVALHSFQAGRKARIVKATHFMQRAIDRTLRKADEIYFKEAERQFTNHMR